MQFIWNVVFATILVVFLFPSFSYSQSKGDNLLEKGQEAFDKRDYEKAEKLWRKSYKAFEKDNEHEKSVENLGLIAKGLMHQFKVSDAKTYYIKMRDEAKKYNLNDFYLRSLNAISTVLGFEGKKDSSILIQRHILKHDSIPYGIKSDSYTFLSQNCTDADSVIYYSQSAINIDSTYNDSSSIAFNYLGLSRAYKDQGKHDMAINKLLRGMKYLRPKKDDFKQITFNINLGYIFHEINHFSKAESYGKTALKLATDFEMVSGQTDAYILLGNNFFAQNNLIDAKYHYNKAAEIATKIKRKSSLAQLDLINAFIALEEKSYPLAKKHLEQMETRQSSKEGGYLRIRYLLARAQYEIATKSPNTLKTINEYKATTSSLSNLYYLRTTESLLKEYYRGRKDYKQALAHNDKYHDYSDSLNNRQAVYALQDIEAQYQQKEHKAEISKLNAENEIKILRLNRQRLFLVGTILGLGILSLFIFFLYRLYTQLKEKNIIIKQALHEKEILIKEVHHRVKNNLQVISALLSLQSKYIKDENALEALRKGNARVESMALIHKDLYQHDNLKGVNARDYCDQLIESLFNSYKIGDDDITLSQEIDDLWLDVDTMIPLGLMMNEFISNALKHAFTEQNHGKIHLSLKEKNDCLVLNIFDNGKGVYDLEQMKKKSFGYSLIQAFARKLKAEIAYEHRDGLNVELTIKKYKKAG